LPGGRFIRGLGRSSRPFIGSAAGGAGLGAVGIDSMPITRRRGDS
jgi:hypothetical protein